MVLLENVVHFGMSLITKLFTNTPNYPDHECLLVQMYPRKSNIYFSGMLAPFWLTQGLNFLYTVSQSPYIFSCNRKCLMSTNQRVILTTHCHHIKMPLRTCFFCSFSELLRQSRAIQQAAGQ